MASQTLRILLVLGALAATAEGGGLRSDGTSVVGTYQSASSDADKYTTCYNANRNLETVTTRTWWNSTIPADVAGGRTDWISKRQPFAPLAGEKTVVLGVLYTFDTVQFKMNVYFPPLYPSENRWASVNVLAADGSGWKGAMTSCQIQEQTWYCPVRLSGLDVTRAYTYEVQYRPNPTNRPNLVYKYTGLVPQQTAYPRVAALGCFGKDNTKDKRALVRAVLETEPDLLVLQGDQTYMEQSLGYGFMELLYTISNITRNVPTLVQMDDHDYGEPNLWGAAYGAEESGRGFHRPACVVNALQELAMSHMPDPVSDQMLANGIEVYYTNYRYGMVDFAVLEARKFKSQAYNGSLLGTDQEAWLRDWCSADQAGLRVVLAQTPFASLGTNVTRLWQPYGLVPALKSTDSNGYPPAARNRFMNIVKGCAPLVLSGDQHLGLAVTYDNYGVSECSSPAAINDVFWRMNFNPLNTALKDSWGNPYRLLKVWNVDSDVYKSYNLPYKTKTADWSVKAKRADGFLVVDLDGSTATCEMHSYRQSHQRVWSVDVPAPAR